MGNPFDAVGFVFYYSMFEIKDGKSLNYEIIGNIYQDPHLISNQPSQESTS